MSKSTYELSYTKTNLMHAINHGDLKTVKLYTKVNARCINWILDVDNSRPIHLAARMGQLAIVQWLLKQDPSNLDLTDTYKQTPLLWAAIKGHADVVQFLLDSGAEFNLATYLPYNKDHNKTPLHWAILNNHLECVKILMQAGAVIDDKRKSHPIHIAARTGRREIVNYLLGNDPTLINRMDADKQIPLFWAAIKGHLHTVRYLISKDSDLRLIPNYSGQIYDYGKVDLSRSSTLSSWGVITYLIANLITSKNSSHLLRLIHTGVEALKLIVEVPRLRYYILDDNRILNLIKADQNCYSTVQSMHLYRRATLKRKNSKFITINKETGKSMVYEPIRILGKGGTGLVRLFQSNNGDNIAVKSLCRIYDEIQYMQSDIQDEYKFIRKTYPEHEIYSIFNFIDEKTNEIEYTNRLIMPYFKQEDLGIYIASIRKDKQCVAKLILKVVEELSRIHQLGIIHGDIKSDNIRVHEIDGQISVYFIDFGLSYYLSDLCATNLACQDDRRYAPERLKHEILIPHTNQDIYSLGTMLEVCLNQLAEYKLAFISQYPCLPQLIKQAQHIEPEKRPTLDDFIAAISQAFNHKTNSALFFKPNIQNSLKSDRSSKLEDYPLNTYQLR